jgi:non-homologous end joining protein Ku
VLDLIERKAAGETITIEEPVAEKKEVPDLMAALEASISASKSPPKKKASSGNGGSKSRKKTSAKKTAAKK